MTIAYVAIPKLILQCVFGCIKLFLMLGCRLYCTGSVFCSMYIPYRYLHTIDWFIFEENIWNLFSFIKYDTAWRQLDTCTQLCDQGCPGGDVGSLNIVCGYPYTLQSQ